MKQSRICVGRPNLKGLPKDLDREWTETVQGIADFAQQFRINKGDAIFLLIRIGLGLEKGGANVAHKEHAAQN